MTEFQKSLVRFMYVALGLFVVLGILAWRPLSARAEFPSGDRYGTPTRGVVATGTCVVRTKPELAEFTVGISQSSKTARAAKDYVKATALKIIEVLKAAGVAERDIRTEDFHLATRWESGKGWQVKKWGASETLRVKVRDVEKAPDLIDAAVTAGASSVGSLNYTVEDLNALRQKGRTKAAEVARKKASELASALGGRLGKLAKCSEGYGDDSYPYYGRLYRTAAQANYSMEEPALQDVSPSELTLKPGELVVTVAVTAMYDLE